MQAFERGLRDLGYVEGREIRFEYCYAEGRPERLPALAADLVRLPCDVIVAGVNPEILAAKRATNTIPIVMVLARDPVQAGLIVSLARPGGNVTGLTIDAAPEAWGKRVELLHLAVPRGSHFALLQTASYPMAAHHVEAVMQAARARRLDIRLVTIARAADFEATVARLARKRIDAVLAFADPTLFAERRAVVDAAIRHRMPVLYTIREFVDAGGLLSYGADIPNLYYRAPSTSTDCSKGPGRRTCRSNSRENLNWWSMSKPLVAWD